MVSYNNIKNKQTKKSDYFQFVAISVMYDFLEWIGYFGRM